MKKTALLICLTLVFAGNCWMQNSIAAENTTAKEEVVAPVKSGLIVVPAGQTFRGVFMAPISSNTAYTGQEVTLALGTDFYYKNKRIAPAGSTITGNVIEVLNAKHGSIDGRIKFRFTHLITPTGLDIPISAIIKTDDNTGAVLGRTRIDVANNYLKDVTYSTSPGTIEGKIGVPMYGANPDKNSGLKNTVGSGGGLLKSIWDKGAEVMIPTNASVDLILIQPITVNPTNEEN